MFHDGIQVFNRRPPWAFMPFWSHFMMTRPLEAPPVKHGWNMGEISSNRKSQSKVLWQQEIPCKPWFRQNLWSRFRSFFAVPPCLAVHHVPRNSAAKGMKHDRKVQSYVQIISDPIPHQILWGSCFWICTLGGRFRLGSASVLRVHNFVTRNFVTHITFSHTHLYRKAIRICDLECNVRAKNKQNRHDETNEYIFFVYINHSGHWPYKPTTIRYMSHPSCDLYAPRGGTICILKRVRLHRNIAASSLAADCNVPQRPPAI